MLSAAVQTKSTARCAQRAVVWTWVCPRSLPLIGSPWPAATAFEAKLCPRLCMPDILHAGTGANAPPKGPGIAERCAGLRADDDPGGFSMRWISCRTSTAG